MKALSKRQFLSGILLLSTSLLVHSVAVASCPPASTPGNTVTTLTPCCDSGLTRQVCRVWANGQDMEEEMVGQGWAFDYPKYSKGEYAKTEANARKHHLGVWEQPTPLGLAVSAETPSGSSMSLSFSHRLTAAGLLQFYG